MRQKHDLHKEMSRPEIEEAIDTWILNERNRAVLKRRLCDHITYESLAEEFDLSVRGVVKIIYKGLEILSRHI